MRDLRAPCAEEPGRPEPTAPAPWQRDKELHFPEQGSNLPRSLGMWVAELGLDHDPPKPPRALASSCRSILTSQAIPCCALCPHCLPHVDPTDTPLATQGTGNCLRPCTPTVSVHRAPAQSAERPGRPESPRPPLNWVQIQPPPHHAVWPQRLIWEPGVCVSTQQPGRA